MEDKSQSEVSELTVVKEGVISDLGAAVESYDGGDIDSLKMLARACNAWKKVNRNPQLKRKLEEEMRRRRQYLHAMAGLDMSEGDPVKERYDPNYWVGKIPPEFKGKEGEFIKDKIGSLSNLFQAL